MEKKMIRKEFLRMAGFGIFAVLILPAVKKINLFIKSHKEARYYKKLAG